jgi:hypothetical protein
MEEARDDEEAPARVARRRLETSTTQRSFFIVVDWQWW